VSALITDYLGSYMENKENVCLGQWFLTWVLYDSTDLL